MCGISALIGKNAQALIDREPIKKMTEVISHRGPDGEGFFFDEKVHLGHRRLSIVDLSHAGDQPMHYKDRYVMVYNGEVYNYIELREELKKQGYSFLSGSDTEVILAAYDYWGADCLHKFNGMWSFVLFDRKEKKVFMARDRFGVKPLYYWKTPRQEMAFASEIKQFTVLPGWTAVANLDKCHDFLKWGLLDHTDDTLFKDVFQVPGGHFVSLNLDSDKSFNNKLPIQKWYEISAVQNQDDFIIAQKKFNDLFTDSINLRLRSDVSVGSCLSGGLDSSSIVCRLNEILSVNKNSPPQKTFSACSEHKKYDEREFIDEVVEKTNVDAHYVYPKLSDLFSNLEKLTWHQDEPFGSTSIFAQWSVFELAKNHKVKVMLDGQGADEQLLGYHTFFIPMWVELFFKLKWYNLYQELKAMKQRHGQSILSNLVKLFFYAMPSFIAQKLKSLIFKKTKSTSDWINHENFNLTKKTNFETDQYLHSVSYMSKAAMLKTSLPMLLHWEDRDSMAHSIEARVPFLDYRLVEYVMNLPTDYKIRLGVTKKILRQAMQNTLPKKISGRMDKMGFVTPEEIWMREQQVQFRQGIQKTIETSNGLVTDEALKMFEDMLAGKRAFDFVFWRIVSFGVWLKVFKVQINKN